MAHIGPHRLQRQLLIEYSAYCHFFSQHTECLFCGITAERPLLGARYERLFAASPAEVAEVAEAAYGEGSCSEMEITGGVLPGRAEIPYVIQVGQAIRERLGVDTIPQSQAVLAALPDRRSIEGIREAGWQGVAFNLEVWDERLWPGFVPGKASLMPRARWLEALEHAARVFGKGQVASVLVAGLEPRRSYLAGVQWLGERGIYGVPMPWAPARGSALEGHQTPSGRWHLEIAARTLDIWERHGLSPQRHSSGGLHYADLALMRQHLREEKNRRPTQRQEQDLRYVLAVEGRLPEM